MRHVNGWKLAVVATALAFAGAAVAQTSTGSPGSTSSSGSGSTATGSSQEPAGTPPSDTSPSGARQTSKQGGKADKKLDDSVQRIHADNQAEIQMGQMAASQGQSPEVKQYGEMLQRDHEKADQKLETAARSAGIQLEGKAFQDEQKDAMKSMDKLHGKTGGDFDKAFMSQMVKDHKKDLKEIQGAQKRAEQDKHAELSTALAATAAGVQNHLDQAKTLEKSVGKGGRAQGRRGAMGSGGSSESMGSSTGSDSTQHSGSTSGSSSSGRGASETNGAGMATPGSSGSPTPERQGTGTGTRESAGQ